MDSLEQRLIAMVSSSTQLMAALTAARGLGLDSWCIGAGAVRSLVWDRLHHFASPTQLDDVDLVYYERPVRPGRDAELESALRAAMPALAWEATNQAGIDAWFRDHLAQHVAPLYSLAEGIATWPEYATCVGVTLHPDDTLGIIAPHGLDDLFALRLRHNPTRAGVDVFESRLASKRFAERWPLLSITAP